MKRLGAWVLVLALLATTAWAQGAPLDDGAPPPIEVHEATVPAGVPPTMADFQQALSPYGTWVQTPDHGPGWVPGTIGTDWRPYENGQWVYTDAGWSFSSFEPWGWPCYHFGRWLYEPALGWVWLPGYEWAPAWVAWRYGAGFIAWAPLGPLDLGIGYYAMPSLWLAVRAPFFDQPLLPTYFVPTVDIGVVLGHSYFAGVPRRGVYFSPPVRHVEGMMGRATPHHHAFVSTGRPPLDGGRNEGTAPQGAGPLHPAPRAGERPPEARPPAHAMPPPPHGQTMPHASAPPPHGQPVPHASAPPPHASASPHISAPPPHASASPHISAPPPHELAMPHISAPPPHELAMPHISEPPVHELAAPHISAPPPHELVAPHISEPPAHELVAPHISAPPPHELVAPHISEPPVHELVAPHISEPPAHELAAPHISAPPPHEPAAPHPSMEPRGSTHR